MSNITAPVRPTLPTATPSGNVNVANLTGAHRLSEKSIELTACAQFGQLFANDATRIVWFGLTQREERKHGFDAATDLGGVAFVLQFKASNTVLKRGRFAKQRRFQCQHSQMQTLRNRFGGTRNSCFYFFPNLGNVAELVAASGAILDNSFLLDVADLPDTIPSSHRKNDAHYAYLNPSEYRVRFTSEPFEQKVFPSVNLGVVAEASAGFRKLQPTNVVVEQLKAQGTARELEHKHFYRNAALVVISNLS